MDEIMKRYYTEEQLAALTQRWEQHGGPSPEQIDYIRRVNAASS